MRKRWSKREMRYKTVLLIAGACFALITGIVFTVHISKLKQEQEKVSTVLQTTEEKGTETEAVEQGVFETLEAEAKTPVGEKQEELEQSDTGESEDGEGKKKKETETGQEKEKEKSDFVRKDSENKKDETKERSQEKQEEPQAEREVSQSLKQKEAEKSYVPISEGWKDAKSAKGEITSAQKAALDAFVEMWKDGSLSDSELKTKIMEYLEEQKITCTEVSVTSQVYALYDQVPKIELSDGGNYYSFVGTYSTGKQNPDGTEKTIFYNWSVFVF